MPESEKKRVRRSVEERIAEIDSKIDVVNHTIADLERKKESATASFDEKIAAARERIKGLEEKKPKILAPKPPRKPRKTKKEKIQSIMRQAQKAGMKPEDIAERLGITLED